jgi:hypothetical protein
MPEISGRAAKEQYEYCAKGNITIGLLDTTMLK